MKKTLLFLTAFLMTLFLFAAKTTYTYKLVKVSTMPDANNLYVYPNASNLYSFKIELSPLPSGFAKGKFTVELENAKFLDGTTKNENLFEGSPFPVVFNDVLNQYGIVKIKSANAIDTSAVILTAGSPTQFSYAIASLKGQTPVVAITGSSNPPMGNKIQLTAQVLGDFIYPGIYERNEYGIIVNKKVKQFQWTLPPNWKTIPQGLTGTITTGIGVNQIIVEPDYFTTGAIQVRGVNDLGTAYSETFVKNYDRGFAFTNYPTSPIPFGQVATYTFTVTPISGVSFEWEVPSGWQINGFGNILEGVNMNTINVTTTGFCSNSSVVRVRLKKDNEISGWFACVYPGIIQPTITTTISPIYQFEESTFSIGNVNLSNIQSISCYGDGIYYAGSQGLDFKVIGLQSGTFTMYVSLLMSGCSTPIIIPKTISVQPHRFSINGFSQICNQETYSINNYSKLNSTATILWSIGNYISILSGQNTPSCSFQKTTGNGVSWIGATISIGGASIILPQKNVWVGSPSISSDISGIYNGQNFGSGGIYSLSVNGAGGDNLQYEWVVYGAQIIEGQGTDRITILTETVYGDIPVYLNVSARVGNTCGWSSYVNRMGYILSDSGPIYIISPNPSTDSKTVTIVQLTTSDNSEVKNWAYEVYDTNHTLKQTKTIKGVKTTEVNTSGWQKGIYFIRIKTGNKIVTQKLVVQ